MDYVGVAICVMAVGVIIAAVTFFAMLPKTEIPLTRTVIGVWSGVKFGFGFALGMACASIMLVFLGFSILGFTVEQLFR